MKTKSLRSIQFLGSSLLICLLTVGCATDHNGRTSGEAKDDKAISSRVEYALSHDTTYKYSGVKVATYKGTVQLSGFVDTNPQKSKASQIASTVAGVRQVENQILLKSADAVSRSGS